METGDRERKDEVKDDGNHDQPHPVTTGMPRGEQIVPRFGFMRETAHRLVPVIGKRLQCRNHYICEEMPPLRQCLDGASQTVSN